MRAAGELTAVCAVMIAVELAAKLCPKNSMVNFARSLICLALLLSAVIKLFSADMDVKVSIAAADNTAGMDSYVEESLTEAALRDWESYLSGLLDAAGVRAKKMIPEADINGDGGIELTKVTVVLLYGSDVPRAAAVLRGSLAESVALEVKTDEG